MGTYLDKKTLYIIRHGETDFNHKNIVQGSGVDTSLNETGQNQAELFYRKYKDHPFDKVYISALQRTRQSVQSFISAGLPYESLPELNEISWGIFEGKEQTPEQRAIYWEVVNRWNKGEVHEKVHLGESPVELQERQKKALEHIMNQPHEQQVLICMHGRALKSFLCLLLALPLEKMEAFPHSNLCLYQLEWNNGKFELIKTNDTSHFKAN